ncbi:UDP-N-acetylglucosamine diphosphorylase [Thamnidium elegans]|nr:UDP-N-acetylglucosamine diphosphorylase [Thamnidium elegans]
MNYEIIFEKYKKAGQEHVFKFFNELNKIDQEVFLRQLSQVEVDQVSVLIQQAMSHKLTQDANKLEPLPQDVIDSSHSQWYQTGLQLIAENKVAVILMAGGQGTRLGSQIPKGCYDIGLPSHKSLFQLQAERIKRLQTLASSSYGKNSIIPWYIMTSGPTDVPTRQFFKQHDYFGLSKQNVLFFKQGVLPCFDLQGKFMLEEKGKLAVAPDGNGGIYNALHREGVIKSLKERGVLYSHCYCVDNSLAKVADPIFIGYCASRHTDVGIKVVAKNNPEEPVGVVARRNGKYGVVEYSEISAELANMRSHQDGNLVYGAANIANHFFSIDFLERVPSFADQLEYHVAHKKIPFIDVSTGEQVYPTKPNGIKLERFVFDVFGHCEAFSVLQVDRADEFAPLKNGSGAGVDCPETSRAAILNQAQRFITQAGGHYQDQSIEVEISPLLSYGGENLEKLNGKYIQKSCILNSLDDIYSQ